MSPRGVNASLSPRRVVEELGECLPGGIMDDVPQVAVAPAYRNNHRLFDDDDEMLMKDREEERKGGYIILL